MTWKLHKNFPLISQITTSADSGENVSCWVSTRQTWRTTFKGWKRDGLLPEQTSRQQNVLLLYWEIKVKMPCNSCSRKWDQHDNKEIWRTCSWQQSTKACCPSVGEPSHQERCREPRRTQVCPWQPQHHRQPINGEHSYFYHIISQWKARHI